MGFIHVIAAAVIDAEGRILIAQRPPGKHLAGSWEFPGGKVERGESRLHALARELKEELGIHIGPSRPLIRVRHSYPRGDVLIDTWVVTHYDGVPAGLDGQALRWCTQDELGGVQDFLAADRPILRVLRLPERLTRSSTSYYEVADICERISDGRLRGLRCSDLVEAESGLSSGFFDFLVMRRKLEDLELERLCSRVAVPVFAVGVDLCAAWALGATGIHVIQ